MVDGRRSKVTGFRVFYEGGIFLDVKIFVFLCFRWGSLSIFYFLSSRKRVWFCVFGLFNKYFLNVYYVVGCMLL